MLEGVNGWVAGNWPGHGWQCRQAGESGRLFILAAASNCMDMTHWAVAGLQGGLKGQMQCTTRSSAGLKRQNHLPPLGINKDAAAKPPSTTHHCEVLGVAHSALASGGAGSGRGSSLGHGLSHCRLQAAVQSKGRGHQLNVSCLQPAVPALLLLPCLFPPSMTFQPHTSSPPHPAAQAQQVLSTFS